MHLTWARVSWCILGALFWSPSVLAQPGSVDTATWLTVRAGDDPCVRASELVADVEGALGSVEPPTGVRVVVEAHGDSWRFELQHGSGAIAERELTDLPSECAPRREAVSLALALAIEHALAGERAHAEEAAQPEPSPEPPAPEPPEAQAPANAPQHQTQTIRMLLGLTTGMNVGLLPRPTAEGRLVAEVSLGTHLALVLGGSFTSRTRSELAEGHLLARAVGPSLDACAGGLTRIGAVYACVGAGLSAVFGQGSGLSHDRRDTTLSATLELGLAGRVPVRRRLLVLWQMGAFVPWLRPRYEALATAARGQPEVVATRTFPPAGGRLLLGLAWQIR